MEVIVGAEGMVSFDCPAIMAPRRDTLRPQVTGEHPLVGINL